MRDNQLKILNRQINLYVDWIINLTDEFKTNAIDLKSLHNLIKTHLESLSNDRKIASELGHFFNSWVIDWDWVAYHISRDYFSYQKLFDHLNFTKKDDDKLLVYKRIDKDSCEMSRNLYLTVPSDIKSEPKVFKFIDIFNNGSNLCRPQVKWNPTIGVTDFGTYNGNSGDADQ